MSNILTEICSYLLLFSLVFGMSATVNLKSLQKQIRNKEALLTGIILQFVLLPFLGFSVVKALDLSSPMGITLLVLTSSPGGSYSNWWCSMFNADLALSVTMTAISTVLSVAMLPANLVIYSSFTYSGDVVRSLDWISLFTSLFIVIGAIFSGLICSAKLKSKKFNLMANKLGNVAGVGVVLFSIFVSSSGDADTNSSMWKQPWEFYFGVALPCVVGLCIANFLSTFFKLDKPERVTVSVECCYQNVGIAASVALTMFEGDELNQAIGVPLYYGGVEMLVLGLYCIFAWKFGWTKAPKDESICVVVGKSYEVENDNMEDTVDEENRGDSSQEVEPDAREKNSRKEQDEETLAATVSLGATTSSQNTPARSEKQKEENANDGSSEGPVSKRDNVKTSWLLHGGLSFLSFASTTKNVAETEANGNSNEEGYEMSPQSNKQNSSSDDFSVESSVESSSESSMRYGDFSFHTFGSMPNGNQPVMTEDGLYDLSPDLSNEIENSKPALELKKNEDGLYDLNG